MKEIVYQESPEPKAHAFCCHLANLKHLSAKNYARNIGSRCIFTNLGQQMLCEVNYDRASGGFGGLESYEHYIFI